MALWDAVESGELKTGYQFIEWYLVNIRDQATGLPTYSRDSVLLVGRQWNVRRSPGGMVPKHLFRDTVESMRGHATKEEEARVSDLESRVDLRTSPLSDLLAGGNFCLTPPRPLPLARRCRVPRSYP
jgi:hypothetical protein